MYRSRLVNTKISYWNKACVAILSKNLILNLPQWAYKNTHLCIILERCNWTSFSLSLSWIVSLKLFRTRWSDHLYLRSSSIHRQSHQSTRLIKTILLLCTSGSCQKQYPPSERAILSILLLASDRKVFGQHACSFFTY